MPKSLNCASSPGKKLPFLTRKICEEMFGVASYPSLPAHFFTMEDTSWGRPAQIIFGGEGKHTHTQVFQTRWSSLNLTLKHLLHFIHLFVLPPVNVSSSSHAHRCTHLVFYRTSAAFFCSCAAQAVDYAFSFVLALHKQLIMHFFLFLRCTSNWLCIFLFLRCTSNWLCIYTHLSEGVIWAKVKTCSFLH